MWKTKVAEVREDQLQGQLHTKMQTCRFVTASEQTVVEQGNPTPWLRPRPSRFQTPKLLLSFQHPQTHFGTAKCRLSGKKGATVEIMRPFARDVSC